MRHFVFDLDGTLFNTRSLVQEAYALAGVVMPPGVWGQPWQVWCGTDAHSRKVAVYQRLLKERDVQMLTPCELANALVAQGESVYVLTGASHESTVLLLKRYLAHATLLGWSLRPQEKSIRLRRLSRGHDHTDTVVYIDDDELGATIAEAAGVGFVAWRGQTYDELKEDVWTALSSQRART